MQAKTLAAGLLAATLAAVVLYPSLRGRAAGGPPVAGPRSPLPQRQKIEAVFVLDTTGSMGGLIDTAKRKIWSIATTMAQATPTPEVRIGLVAYRDRGDAYVTRTVDLGSDLDSMYAALMDFRAEGGGDGPESVNRALDDAVRGISWSRDPSTYRVVFLVGDAPPHMDYQDDRKYPEILAEAAAKGIVVNTIQCGSMPETVAPWKRIAALGHGRYLEVEQAGGAVAVETPFDGELAKLSAQLDGTRLYYGSAGVRAAMEMKRAATAKLEAAAPAAARASRGVFDATASGSVNLAGAHDLVSDVANGKVDLGAVPAAELPKSMVELSADERRRLVETTAERRDDLRQRIGKLAAERDAFIAKKLAERGGAADSLDHQIYDTLREQGAAKGLRFDKGPVY